MRVTAEPGPDSSAPTLSVLMPIYNASAYLKEAVESVLSQTFADFEVIAIDDGSKDDSLAILKDLAAQDPRVHIWTKPNGGIVEALNLGLEHCRGNYIARMDADDICTPLRFQTQLDYLALHPEVDACGSWMEVFWPGGTSILRWDSDDDRIRAALSFRSSFPHPASTFRTSFFQNGLIYRKGYPHAEDYDLWVRAIATKRFHTLPDPIYRYRQHEEQVTIKHLQTCRQSAAKIRQELFAKFPFSSLSEEELQLHETIVNRQTCSKAQLAAAAKWLHKLRAANRAGNISPPGAFDEIVAEYWWDFCRANAGDGLSTWFTYTRGPLHATPNVTKEQQMKLFARCFLRKGLQTTE